MAAAAVAGTATHSSPGPVPEALLALALVGALATVQVFVERDWFPYHPLPATTELVLVLSFAVAGLLLRRSPDQRSNGNLLVVAAFLWQLGDLGGAHLGALPFGRLAYVCTPLGFVPLAVLLLRWPGTVLGHGERRFVKVLLLVLPGVRLLDILAWDSRWGGYFGPEANVHLPTPRALHDDVTWPAVHGVAVAAVLVFLVLLVRHWRRQRRLDQVELLPLAASAAVAAVVVALADVEWLVPWWHDRPVGQLDNAQRLATLLLPLSFVVVAVAHRLSSASAAGVVRQVSTGTDVEVVLREALGDRELQVLYRVDDRLVTGTGAAAAPAPGRTVVPVRDVDGQELAVMVVHPSVERHRELLEAVAAAAALGIANAALRAAALVQLAEVRASRQRIAESGLDARRRLERDLHDGAQQRLLAVSASLSRARSAKGADASEALDETRDELRRAIAELRDLARGVHPALLSQMGLGAALADVAVGCAVPVTTSICPGRWPPPVESTAYFVVCEALTNAAKHASPTGVEVVVEHAGTALVVRVTDDGTGVVAVEGSGLRGLRDRVGALGGRLSVRSIPGTGTTVEAAIPCE